MKGGGGWGGGKVRQQSLQLMTDLLPSLMSSMAMQILLARMMIITRNSSNSVADVQPATQGLPEFLVHKMYSLQHRFA